MRFRTDDQRKAAFARMRVRGFPIHGRGGTAKRNRAILGALGVASAGTAIVATAAYSRGGLAKLLLSPAAGYHYKSPAGYNLGGAFTSMRQPVGVLENALARVRAFGTVRAVRHGGKKYGEAAEVFSVPLLSRLKIGVTRGVTRAGRHTVDVDSLGNPIMRPGYRKVGGVVNRLARSVDNASLWRMLGRGKLYGDLTEDARFATKEGVRRLIKRGENFLIAPRRVLTKAARTQLQANQKLAREHLKLYRKEQAALETTLKGRPHLAAVVRRKHANRKTALALLDQEYNMLRQSRLVKPSRADVVVHRSLNRVQKGIRRTDWRINRGARALGRKLGLDT